jgi:hypothetical protein
MVNVSDVPELVIVNVSPDCEPVVANPLVPENVIVEVPDPVKYVKKFWPLSVSVFPSLVNVYPNGSYL